MIGLHELECTCLIRNISRADKILAEMLEVSEEDAHNLTDTFEEALDQALQEKWQSR